MIPTTETSIDIRDIETSAEMHAAEQLQKEVWGIPDIEVVPLSQLVASKTAGGILVGAFDAENLVGFVYGFVSIEHKTLVHHSHMLAVRRAYRNHKLGYRLKLAQRERALDQDIEFMSWTFDPLQSLNAYFNFRKLGVISDRYFVDFYGGDAASFLHQNGTDRLWVTWPLSSEKVRRRIDGIASAPETNESHRIVEIGNDNAPRLNSLKKVLSGTMATVEIPVDISNLEKQNGDLAHRWRDATRTALTEAINAKFSVVDFVRGEQHGTYVLSRNKSLD